MGAHHYDLRANHVNDTGKRIALFLLNETLRILSDEIREVRAHESAIITKWIKQAQARNM